MSGDVVAKAKREARRPRGGSSAPVVFARRRLDQLIVECPYHCAGRRHIHGPGPGHRAADCLASGGYFIVEAVQVEGASQLEIEKRALIELMRDDPVTARQVFGSLLSRGEDATIMAIVRDCIAILKARSEDPRELLDQMLADVPRVAQMVPPMARAKMFVRSAR